MGNDGGEKCRVGRVSIEKGIQTPLSTFDVYPCEP